MCSYADAISVNRRSALPELSSSQTSTMLSLLNNLRAQYGVPPVSIDSRFTAVAQSQSNYQASTCTMSHYGANGATLGQRVLAITGLSNLYLGENVAAGQTSVESVFNSWKNSAGHLENMVSKNFNAVGFGYTGNGNCYYKTYWTQTFGGVSKISSSSPPPSGGTTGKLGDWDFCSASSQCSKGCCSKEYSNDGKLKCTPGGTQCVVGSVISSTLPTTTTPKSTTTTTKTTTSSISSSPAISPVKTSSTSTASTSTTSIKASPLTSPSSVTNLGEWEFCSSSKQCANKCCSKEYSGDGKFKCTPSGTQCLVDPITSITSSSPTPPSSSNLGLWDFCSKSSQCTNRCCSNVYSGDGKFKCTPNTTQCV
ncbi:hypothetical protein HK098_001844 [Nowakowskiella sp. JEL0407]|nr:hypothetical protein HK098_001844 [Nowakowskiella sp. JEL0407]